MNPLARLRHAAAVIQTQELVAFPPAAWRSTPKRTAAMLTCATDSYRRTRQQMDRRRPFKPMRSARPAHWPDVYFLVDDRPLLPVSPVAVDTGWFRCTEQIEPDRKSDNRTTQCILSVYKTKHWNINNKHNSNRQIMKRLRSCSTRRETQKPRRHEEINTIWATVTSRNQLSDS